jgi:hypothetical protein
MRIEVLGLQNNHILLILVFWNCQLVILLIVSLLLGAFMHVHRYQFGVIAILQNFEAEVVLVLEAVEEHFGKVHGLLECLGVWEGAGV